MFLLETSTDETAPRSLKTPRSDCSLLRHHLEGTPTCGKFAGPKPAAHKLFLDRYRLRLLPDVPRQSRRITVHPQFLRAPRAQLVLRQHAENRLANHPVRFRFAQPLGRHFLQPARIPA